MAVGADDSGTGGGTDSGRTWAAVVVGLVLLAAWLLGHGGPTAPAPPPGARALSAAAAADRPAQVYAPHVPLHDAVPLRIDIPSVGIHAELVGRGLKDGAVDPPPYSTPDVAGWYRDGPPPGAAGAAIIVGHVDTETRAAVFYGLSTVQRGALVEVARDDGTVAEFSVEAVEVIEKAHFDATRVYGSAGRPELRLITCGGAFDKDAQAYSANVVVFAALTGSHPS
ncbi:class F sortase [Streptomyces cocklensis]|jgi:sortase (surface protein transpeptidase)|uniref:Sortase family protein n=1 Tax=Actinacidiphila cocklensis TaxID=887465 RepID=A0A9W4DNU2_9ACTN|nr:class F sortase [Actinacidiphila cocklensis]MDD1058281.1 class F sortase [Actinacidiphila cocklensis]WSX79311.1 class F sortase [Streptomyces sp. NBC_00899]CAG6393341.1 Sortase family protein [Actinacidiphila cocklensis]